MSTEPTVLYRVADGIATLTLNRPDVFNAFNLQLHTELMAALRKAERDPLVRCIVLTGAGKAFCSGQDLREFSPDNAVAQIGEHIRGSYNPLISKLRSLPQPVIAAVNGPAVGAGMSLALACDLRIAAASATFSAAFVNIGLIPDSGMVYFLPRLIGPARALELCMTGESITAATAQEWGMVNKIFPDAEFAAAGEDFALRLAKGPATALKLIKRAFAMSQEASLAQVLEYEAQAQQIAGGHSDFAEGVRAFREKRRPKWEG